MSTSGLHQALVDRLVADVSPVRPLRAHRLFFAWVVLQAVALTALAGHACRPDIGPVLHRPLFVAQVLALMTSGTLAAWLAARGAFPDRAAGPLSVAAVVGLGMAGLIPIVTSTPPLPASFVARGVPCLTMTVMAAAAPWLALLLLVGRGAPVLPARTGLLAAVAAFLLAAAGMRAACSLDEPLHLLAWHAAPVVGGGAVSALFGAVFLGRWAASGGSVAERG
jgi:hypothetical protein